MFVYRQTPSGKCAFLLFFRLPFSGCPSGYSPVGGGPLPLSIRFPTPNDTSLLSRLPLATYWLLSGKYVCVRMRTRRSLYNAQVNGSIPKEIGNLQKLTLLYAPSIRKTLLAQSSSTWWKSSLCTSFARIPARVSNHNNNKRAYAGQVNRFTHLRALLVLHDRGIFWPGAFLLLLSCAKKL